MQQPKKKRKNKAASDADYVSNQDLLDALIGYKQKKEDAEKIFAKLKEIFNLTSENKLFDKPDINYYLENVSDSDLEETESSSESDESDESDESESVSSISSDSSEEIKFKSKRSLKK